MTDVTILRGYLKVDNSFLGFHVHPASLPLMARCGRTDGWRFSQGHVAYTEAGPREQKLLLSFGWIDPQNEAPAEVLPRDCSEAHTLRFCLRED